MKEHQSHISMVARFAYIFATIVTVFAQMGAAAPAMITEADVSPTASMLVDKNGYEPGEDMAITITTTNMPQADLHFDPTYFSYASVDDFGGSVKNSSGVVELTPSGANVGTVTVHFKVKQALPQGGSSVSVMIDSSAFLGIVDTSVKYDTIIVTDTGNMSRADVKKTTVNNGGTVNDKEINLSVPGGIELTKDKYGNISNYGLSLNVYGTTAKTGTHTRAGSSMPWVTTGDSFVITWKGDNLTVLTGATDAALQKAGFYADWGKIEDKQVTITAGETIPAGWNFDMEFMLKGDTAETDFTVKTDEGIEIDTVEQDGPGVKQDPDTTTDPTTEPTTDPDPTEATNNLTTGDLSLTQLSSSPYDLKDSIQYLFTANLDNYPTQYRDVQFKVNEIDENGDATNQKAIFDPDLTKDYAEKNGLSVSGPTESEDHTVYTYSNGDQEYNVWVFKDNSIRVEFAKGTTGLNNGFLVMRANQSSDKVTLTPTFVGSKAANDDPVKLKDGTGFDFKINPSPTVDATGLRLDPQAVAPVNGEPYRLSAFPLFYIKDDATTPALYSFIYNYNSTGIEGGSKTGSLESLRKAIIAGDAYSDIKGGAESTNSNQPGYFENFHAIDSEGKAIDGSEQPFDVDKTYTMIPYNPVAGTNDRFQRIDTDTWESKNYYMPDGIPTFSVDATGKITLKSAGDGKAVKGQWSADGSQINVKLYHVKQVKVVDQDGQPVPNATLNLKNTAGSDAISLHGKTGAKGEAGDLYPSDNRTFDDTQPFYYPDGTQAFGRLDLPADYTQDITFTSMALSKTDDTLSLTGEKNAEIVDNGQTLQLTVWRQSDADSQVNIKKVDSTDQSPLAGANFTVEETDNSTNDGWKTPSGTTLASGDDGMVSGISVDPDSAAKTRTFHITETKAPDDYQVANQAGYDATWTKGTGFTAVGETEAPTDDQSADGVVKIENGTLVFADSKLLFGGGGATSSGLKFQYINSAGEPIAGAQLPTLEENHQYGSTTDGLGISGIGGIIYNPESDPTQLTTPDSGLVAGTGLAHDSTMATSQEKSDDQGMGTVQALWTQLGLSPDWESLSKTSNAYILSHAIMAGFLPNTPAMVYGLYTEDQQARQEATNASGYYSMGGTVQIGETNKVITASVASDNKVLRDNRIVVDTEKNTVQVQLYKVKHIAITDANDKAIVGATVRFTNLVSAEPTDSNGEADLVPADNQGNATTSFAFPAPAQQFISAKDAQGNELALGDNPTDFSTWMGDAKADQLASSGSTANIKISDGTNAEHAAGQYVELKTTTAQTKTVVRIHKQSATNADQAIAGVTFKVWNADTATGTPFTTDPTDDNGNTTATFDTASSNDTYTIQENTVPDGFSYKQDTQTHTFSADDSGLVTGVKAGDSVITTDPDGKLHFADMPVGGGGVGENGTNGGDLTIEKVDLNDATAKVPDGTVFTIKDAVYGGTFETTATVKDGVAVAKLGDPTDGDRTFTIQETTAPEGYDKNNTKYRMKIDNKGNITVGAADDLKLVANHTPDNVITLNGYHLVYGDTKTVTGNNGGIFTLKKIDASNAVVTPPDGAEFTLTEAGTSSADEVGQFTAGGLINFDLGKPTAATRQFTLTERTAPLGYVWNTLQYAVAISPTGTVTVGSGNITSNPTYANQTSDKVVTATDKGVTFADDPVTTQKNGGELVIKKVGMNDRTKAIKGATFGLSESVNNDLNDFGTAATPMTSDANGSMTIQLGQPTNTTRTLRLNELSAPTGYIKNAASYWITINPSGKYQVVGVDPKTGVKADPASSTPDSVLQVDADNHLTFGNYRQQTTTAFFIKKVDQSTGNAITTNLNGASFSANEITLAGTTFMGDHPVADTGLTSEITTSLLDTDLRLVKINETIAPSGYTKSDTPYYVTLSPDDGVVGVSTKAQAVVDQKTSEDGVVKIEDSKTVDFADAAKASGISIKKVDASDATKSISGSATFHLTRVVPSADPAKPDTYNVSTTDNNVISTKLSDPSITEATFRIDETAAPGGYIKDTKGYYFRWNATDGVIAVAADDGTELQKFTGQTVKNSAGQTVLSIDHGVLNFGDVQQTISPNALVIRKVDATDPTQGLGGATFNILDNMSQQSKPVTTDSDGIAQFTPPVPSNMVYKITETTAPGGYVKASKPYYVQWSKGKITMFGVGSSLDAKHTGTYEGATLDAATGILSITNKQQSNTITTDLRSASNGGVLTAIGGINVTLSSSRAGGTALKLPSDQEGKITITPGQVAAVLGLSTIPTSGSYDVRINVGSDGGLYTDPLSRLVKYTFNNDPSKAGFSIYNSNSGVTNSSTEALKQNDGMFVDNADDSSVGAGNLRTILRHDTINAKGTLDDGTDLGPLAGAQFTLTFNVNGTSYTTDPLPTDANGQYVLPDPNTLLDKTDLIPIDDGKGRGKINVTVNELNAVGPYMRNTEVANLTYQSGIGYGSLANIVLNASPTATVSRTMNGNAKSTEVQMYFFGGSSITYWLTKQISELSLDEIPDTMNFGRPQVSSSAQTMPLLNASVASDDQADFNVNSYNETIADEVERTKAIAAGILTDESTVSTPNGDLHTINAKVTQTGPYTKGWNLTLKVWALTSEDGSDVIDGGEIIMKKFTTMQRNGEDATLSGDNDATRATNMGGTYAENTLVESGENSVAGTYDIGWNVKDVSMYLPAMVGQNKTNYQAPMTWHVVAAP